MGSSKQFNAGLVLQSSHDPLQGFINMGCGLNSYCTTIENSIRKNLEESKHQTSVFRRNMFVCQTKQSPSSSD